MHDGRHAVGAERQPAGGGVDHGHRPREDVHRAGRAGAGQLLGRHVGRRADEPAGNRRRVGQPGDAEVDDARAVGAQQDVGRLEIPVHHPGAVDRGQRGSRADREALQVPFGQRPAGIHPFLQRRAVDELADDIAPLALGRRLDDPGRDERLHLVDRVELAGQPLQDVGVGGRPQHLDGDPFFTRIRPVAEVDDALATLAQPAEQLETPQARGIAWFKRLGRHGCESTRTRGTRSCLRAGYRDAGC